MSKLSYCYLGRFQIFQDFKKNIDANIETIESIQIIKYNAIPRSVDKENQLDKCVICLGEFIADEECFQLHCTHYFHAECIKHWLLVNKSCPSCTYNVESDKNEENTSENPLPHDPFQNGLDYWPIIRIIPDNENNSCK